VSTFEKLNDAVLTNYRPTTFLRSFSKTFVVQYTVRTPFILNLNFIHLSRILYRQSLLQSLLPNKLISVSVSSQVKVFKFILTQTKPLKKPLLLFYCVNWWILDYLTVILISFKVTNCLDFLLFELWGSLPDTFVCSQVCLDFASPVQYSSLHYEPGKSKLSLQWIRTIGQCFAII
jgi:hypothetical protein